MNKGPVVRWTMTYVLSHRKLTMHTTGNEERYYSLPERSSADTDISVRGVQQIFVGKLEISQKKTGKNLLPPPVVNELRTKVTVE